MKIHAITLTVTLIYIFSLNKRNEHVMKIRVRLSEDAGDEQSNYEEGGFNFQARGLNRKCGKSD